MPFPAVMIETVWTRDGSGKRIVQSSSGTFELPYHLNHYQKNAVAQSGLAQVTDGVASTDFRFEIPEREREDNATEWEYAKATMQKLCHIVSPDQYPSST